MKRLNYEDVKRFVEGARYEMVSDRYVNGHTKIKLRCKHGHEFEMPFNDFKHGHGCPYCAKCAKLSYDFVKEYIEKEGYILLSREYVRNSAKLKMICPKGHEIDMSFSSFQGGRRCKVCAGNQRYDYETVKKLFKSEGYTLISEVYTNNHTKLDIICPNGHHIQLSLKHFLRGIRCSVCSKSSGETQVAKILDDNKINYIHQQRFEDCKDRGVLPFDFYIPDLNACVEYDGKQHFEPIPQFDGEEGFIDRQNKDRIKNQYCEDNGINLIRIPYWDFNNIEEILISQLNLHSNKTLNIA